MKKLLLGAGLLLSTLSFAQVDFSSTRYGIIAGPDYSGVKNAHNPSGKRISFFAGGFALIPIDKDNQFYLQPGLEYLSAGENGKDKNAKGAVGYNAVYANNYISVPIYFKAYFSEAESEFFAIAGPKFNFLISQKVTNAAKLAYTVEGDPLYPGVNGKANGLNFALGLGVGYSYKRKVEFLLRYDLGFSNTYKGLMNEYGTDANIQKKKSEQVLSAGLSYIFD